MKPPPQTCSCGRTIASAHREACLLAGHRNAPTVPIAEDDRAIVVSALEAEVDGLEGDLDLSGPDGFLDPFAAHEHLSRYLPLLAHAREGRALVSLSMLQAVTSFAESWRVLDGSESDPGSLRHIAAHERVRAKVAAALTGADAGRSLEPRMVSVHLDEAATRAAVIAVSSAAHHGADALTHVGSPWSDTTPADLGRIMLEAQRVARLSAFGDRLGWNGDRACTFTGTEGELLDLAVLLRTFADGAKSASRHVDEPTATEDRALAEAAARASRLLAGSTGPGEPIA